MSSGYTDNLPDDVLLDTGVVYVGDSPWGVTKGGVTFNPGAEWRNVDYDGKKGPVLGLDRKGYQAPTLSGRFLQFGEADIPRFEPGVDETSGSAPVVKLFTPPQVGELLASGDYLTNVRCVFSRGQGGFVQVRFPKAKGTFNSISGQDRNEGEVDAVIEARRDPATMDEGDPLFVIETMETIS